MKLIVQSKSETPIYEQLYNQIVLQILGGQITANECLPSIRVVARELQISVIPVKTAYEKLEKEGYMYTIPAKGCFVADIRTQHRNKKMALATQSLKIAVDYCKQLGLTYQETIEIVEKLF